MFKHILIGLFSAFLAFFTYVAMKPAAFNVSRSTVIAAAPSAVYPHIASFKKWQAWSPWAKKDPAAKASYSGPESGVGATFEWSGNSEVGEGAMAIVDAKTDERVGIKLTFTKPMAGSSDVLLTLRPEGQGTSVTWAIAGQNGFVARAFMMLFGYDMEKMIGDEYAKGLANLKAVVEGAPKS
ncbi:MAG: SRPBCC family protein [Hyphomicrobiaceae bacterium]